MSSTFTYMPYHQSRKDLRRGLCTRCGNKYLINIRQGMLSLFTRRIRVVDTWYSYWFREGFEQAFSSPCCKSPMARTRISVGDVFRVIE